MKYPAVLRKFNKALGAISGVLLLAIAVMSVVESLMRTVFINPTKWTLDISAYFLLIAIFIGSGYAYQEKGHVGVELFKDMIEKRFGDAPRRVMSIGGYVLSMIVIFATMLAVYRLLIPALEINQTTFANITIPISLLYIVMIVGSVIMAVTVFFIILDLCKKGNEWN
ncbi:MAG: TRAP transporter small permease subunit [Clostridiales Family XIII bacterium]|jgi:TRAP-type C4-dicarboxylate transport system permease small subunit|nr:TRAP transporter small permease subunit [Clostridiales Family XIII bacterium]